MPFHMKTHPFRALDGVMKSSSSTQLGGTVQLCHGHGEPYVVTVLIGPSMLQTSQKNCQAGEDLAAEVDRSRIHQVLLFEWSRPL